MTITLHAWMVIPALFGVLSIGSAVHVAIEERDPDVIFAGIVIAATQFALFAAAVHLAGSECAP